MNKMNLHNEKGQSLIIIAFGIITLIAFIGLAVDLGIAYVERIRIRRAADAAALAAAAELPLEGAAHIRALEFLEENDYGCGLQVGANAASYQCTLTDTVRVEIDNNYFSGPLAADAERIIHINTIDYRNEDNPYLEDSADRIRVDLTANAPVYFMRVFSFLNVPVKGSATAENINHLDIALVFDVSGSMEFDTLCYGCWQPTSGDTYPNGTLYPLPWDGDLNGKADHCEGGDSGFTYSYKYNNVTYKYKYILLEAEEYSRNTPIYSSGTYNTGMTYWMIQRNSKFRDPSYYLMGSDPNEYGEKGTAGAFGRDADGAYLQHNPFADHVDASGADDDGNGASCTWNDLNNGGMCIRDSEIESWSGPFEAPRVDYDFTVPSDVPGGIWYVWIRGQGGYYSNSKYVFWGLNGTPMGKGTAGSSGNWYNGALSDEWTFRRVTDQNGSSKPLSLTANVTNTLNIWGGGAGFRLDRIIITNDPRDPSSFFSSSTSDNSVRSAYSSLVSHVLKVPATDRADNNRTDWACDPCDVRFGGSPSPTNPTRPVCTAAMAPQPNRLLDEIYDDEQPIRDAVEAAKTFVRRLDPRYDQIGYVTYGTGATIKDQLQCVRRLGADACAAGYDKDSGFSSDEIEDSVIKHLDETHANGGTAIPAGIYRGIEVLSNRSGNYGRPGAAHIMILMTDGRANSISGVDATCYSGSNAKLWPPMEPSTVALDRATDCTVYHAIQARDNGVVIYTITLGASADIELMEHVAELTGGVHRNAPRPEQLAEIFDELYERIFLRLVE